MFVAFGLIAPGGSVHGGFVAVALAHDVSSDLDFSAMWNIALCCWGYLSTDPFSIGKGQGMAWMVIGLSP